MKSTITKTLTKILSIMFCVAVFLGMLDAIISLSNHLAEKTANAGEQDVQSVQEATEVYINKNGTLESYTRNKLPIQNAVIKNNEFTPVEIKNTDNFTPVTLQKQSWCSCSNTCTCTKGGCFCKINKTQRCNPSCQCFLLSNTVQNSCNSNSCNSNSVNTIRGPVRRVVSRAISRAITYRRNFGRFFFFRRRGCCN